MVETWALVVAVVAAVSIIAFLCLVVRRALTELFFWRGAFKCASDRAYELLAEASAKKAEAAGRKEPGRRQETGSDQETGGRNNGSIGRSGKTETGTPVPSSPESLLQRYRHSLDSVMQEAQRRNIDWISEADREYYWTHHAQDRQSPDLSVT